MSGRQTVPAVRGPLPLHFPLPLLLLVFVLLLQPPDLVRGFQPLFSFSANTTTHRVITQRALLRKTAQVCRDVAVAAGRDFSLTVSPTLDFTAAVWMESETLWWIFRLRTTDVPRFSSSLRSATACQRPRCWPPAPPPPPLPPPPQSVSFPA